MTFSEHVCDVHNDAAASGRVAAAKRKGKSEEAKSGPKDVLKVGQSVVLMDSSLRGKIAQIGKTVRIELEDGLMIEASYGEFAVTDDAEISSLKQTKVKASKAGRAGLSGSGSSYPAGVSGSSQSPAVNAFKPAPDGTLTVDLHIEVLPGGRNVPKGQQLQFQLDTFRRIIRTNLSRKGLKITFIHGIGDGILKSAIRKELDEVLPLHCTYTVGDPALTVVTIR
ncbi:MAG: hypothetical protein IKU36_00430 [Bacteroidales bacterium]|nr:hypothetical protein [Bacteroidales bacterium]